MLRRPIGWWHSAASGSASSTPTTPCWRRQTRIRRTGTTRRPWCCARTFGCCCRGRTPPETWTPRPTRCWHCSTWITSSTISPRAVIPFRRWATRGKAWRASSVGGDTPIPKTTWVLHVDLDQFLASVELRRRPDLAGLPVIVGGNGDPTEPRKVVTCASYEAREFGVHAGMPLRAAARRCAAATFLPSDPPASDAASDQVMGLLRDLGHPVEVWGWDEAYVGVTADDPNAVAEEIRTIISSETGLSCSVGISDNKQRAKVATGFAKPAGIFTLTDANWMTVMADRPVDALWGVGPKTAKKLAALDITTVMQLAHSDAELLTSTFGPRTGLWLLLLAKGGGDAHVSAEPWVPRSRSHVVTFPRDLTDRAEMDSAVTELARRALDDVVEAGRVVIRVAVTVRTSTFYTRTKIRKLAAPTTDGDVIIAAALRVLDLFELDRPVRLLGVRLELEMPA